MNNPISLEEQIKKTEKLLINKNRDKKTMEDINNTLNELREYKQKVDGV